MPLDLTSCPRSLLIVSFLSIPVQISLQDDIGAALEAGCEEDAAALPSLSETGRRCASGKSSEAAAKGIRQEAGGLQGLPRRDKDQPSPASFRPRPDHPAPRPRAEVGSQQPTAAAIGTSETKKRHDRPREARENATDEESKKRGNIAGYDREYHPCSVSSGATHPLAALPDLAALIGRQASMYLAPSGTAQRGTPKPPGGGSSQSVDRQRGEREITAMRASVETAGKLLGQKFEGSCKAAGEPVSQVQQRCRCSSRNRSITALVCSSRPDLQAAR